MKQKDDSDLSEHPLGLTILPSASNEMFRLGHAMHVLRGRASSDGCRSIAKPLSRKAALYTYWKVCYGAWRMESIDGWPLLHEDPAFSGEHGGGRLCVGLPNHPLHVLHLRQHSPNPSVLVCPAPPLPAAARSWPQRKPPVTRPGAQPFILYQCPRQPNT